MKDDLSRMEALLETAKAEYKLLHAETERLTAAEYDIHIVQQQYVHKRNAMQTVVQSLHSVVSAMKKEAQDDHG
jgi:hypothetical protein